MITVKELIKKLENEDQERVIIMSRDPEGNSYSPFENFWTGAYSEEGREAGLDQLTQEDEDYGFTEDDILEGTPALILQPSY